MNARPVEILLVALGVVAFLGTWAQVPAYLAGGFWAGQLAFWKDTVVSPASTFLVVDILGLAAVVVMWLFSECRRLSLAPYWAWVYFLGGTLIGISLFVPLFFAHRERRLHALGKEGGISLAGSDWLAVALLLVSVAAGCAWSLTHLPHSG